MENKYFTPELEELHVGYQCEIREDLEDNEIYWETYTIVESDLQYLSNWLTGCELRTKCLDRKQLQKEGFYNQGSNLYFPSDLNFNHRCCFSFYPETYKIEFHDLKKENSFAGIVKSINEFRNIIKYLEI